MPCDYSLYPKNWRSEIRPRILARAGNKCEVCGVPNYAIGTRSQSGFFRPYGGNMYWDDMQYTRSVGEAKEAYARAVETWDNDPDEPKPIQIILTVAHLDHDNENKDVTDDRLRAMCQKCHLNYDKKHHMKNSAATRAKKKSQQSLF